jgi:hypothetical protein
LEYRLFVDQIIEREIEQRSPERAQRRHHFARVLGRRSDPYVDSRDGERADDHELNAGGGKYGQDLCEVGVHP